ncbi:AMP-binding protein, partial [Rhodovulum sulfidophilum]|nr:AMP-binding protein [Rhodovulum sulfidophilum]
QVMEALSATFRAPVIEAYGMTEAAHQMTSNPLPPRAQKPGSVGVAAGPQVRIADEASDRLIEGTGEVVISGPNVTAGYESNEAANAKSFFEAEGERWFRTGDQGRFDSEGYLTITGRLKEIINRGGEKISPLEVDGVLMDHPAVLQVVTFALPHPKLGEEVAAAVVLREGMAADEVAIRAFCADRLAEFKVPRRVVLLDEIPKGATGKLQRIGLAEKLGLVSPA